MTDMWDVRITDTSLRDGSHHKRHQFTKDEVGAIVAALDAAGVPVIEVTHGDGLGGSSFNYGFSKTPEQELIKLAAATAKEARIAFLMLPGVGTKDDIKEARDNGGSICRIATHCTEADVSIQHFGLARELGLETVGFLMMAHTIAPEKLAAQARIMADAGCQCVYVVDSAGALSVAGLLEADIEPGSTVVCLISGGNNDVSRYGEVLERSLVHLGLKHYFLVDFPQEPGALRRFLDDVLGPNDDITLFEYVKRNNRETGEALVGIELGSAADLDGLLARMRATDIHVEALEPGSPAYRYLL